VGQSVDNQFIFGFAILRFTQVYGKNKKTAHGYIILGGWLAKLVFYEKLSLKGSSQKNLKRSFKGNFHYSNNKHLKELLVIAQVDIEVEVYI
jgi:hypothetical protein